MGRARSGARRLVIDATTQTCTPGACPTPPSARSSPGSWAPTSNPGHPSHTGGGARRPSRAAGSASQPISPLRVIDRVAGPGPQFGRDLQQSAAQRKDPAEPVQHGRDGYRPVGSIDGAQAAERPGAPGLADRHLCQCARPREGQRECRRIATGSADPDRPLPRGCHPRVSVLDGDHNRR